MLLLQSVLIKSKISKSLNSASVPQNNFYEVPITKVHALGTSFLKHVLPVLPYTNILMDIFNQRALSHLFILRHMLRVWPNRHTYVYFESPASCVSFQSQQNNTLSELSIAPLLWGKHFIPSLLYPNCAYGERVMTLSYFLRKKGAKKVHNEVVYKQHWYEYIHINTKKPLWRPCENQILTLKQPQTWINCKLD